MCSLKPQLYGREEKELSCKAAFPHLLFFGEDAEKCLPALFRKVCFSKVWPCLFDHCLPLPAIALLSLGWWSLPISWMLCLVAQKGNFLHSSAKWHLKNMHFSAWCVKMCENGFLYFIFVSFQWPTKVNSILYNSLMIILDSDPFFFFFFFHFFLPLLNCLDVHSYKIQIQWLQFFWHY